MIRSVVDDNKMRRTRILSNSEKARRSKVMLIQYKFNAFQSQGKKIKENKGKNKR